VANTPKLSPNAVGFIDWLGGAHWPRAAQERFEHAGAMFEKMVRELEVAALLIATRLLNTLRRIETESEHLILHPSECLDRREKTGHLVMREDKDELRPLRLECTIAFSLVIGVQSD